MTGLLGKYWGAWQRFWFTKENPLAVCVMRWPMVGMILYSHLIWTYVPTQWMWTAQFVSLLILLLFWVGFATPITGWLCFIIVVSCANRVPLAMYGLDQVNGIAALYLANAPCGARLSVDAWIRRVAGKAGGRSFWGGCQQRYAQPASSARLAIRLFQVHLCFIYLWGGLGKLQGETWWSGEAVWLTAASLSYQSNDLTWMVYFSWLYQSLSVATWVWEISFSILVWQPRLRPWILFVGVMMHLGIGMFLGMWTFGLAMIFIYLAFIPTETYKLVAMRMALIWQRWFLDLESPVSISDRRIDERKVSYGQGGR